VNELPACDARQDDTESPGAGRAKLHLSRGFPLGLAPQYHPQVLAQIISLGVTSQANAPREVPVRTEPHPTPSFAEQAFSTLCAASERGGFQMPGLTGQASSSRTIKIDRFNLAIMAVHVQSDGTATDFAILNRGKRAGRSVNDRGEDRSAVGANNA
jgi:hypothetical protein